MSSLAYAEAWAVMGRLRRERILADILIEAASEALHQEPWRRLHSGPDWKLVRSLAEKWRLRGADLWHLATARSLKAELTDLVLLTFDARLQEAAAGEGLVPRAQMIRRPHRDR
jgi:predicted nucleic acid-binding protein